MKVPTVDNFFGCIFLRTGALIIGYICAITYGLSAVIALLLLIFALDAFKSHVMKISDTRVQLSPDEIDPYSVPALTVDHFNIFPTPPPTESMFEQAFVVIMVIVIVILAVLCFISVLFLKGIYEQNASKTKPFLWVNVVSTVLYVLQILSMIKIVDFVWCGLSIYFCIVVYSMYLMLLGGEQFQQKNPQEYTAQYTHAGVNQTYDQNAYGMEGDRAAYQASEYQGP